MNHQDHVNLLGNLQTKQKEVWLDLGSGWGAFTLALRDIGGNSISIISVDQDKSILETQQSNFERQFPQTNISYINQDFTKEIPVINVGGILMANSLHYIKDQMAFINRIKFMLPKNGRLIIIEYDTDVSNFWLPYPISYNKLRELLKNCGFQNVKKTWF